jgi:hypothetical protein
MPPVTLQESPHRVSASAITRWMRLIELHGGPAEALQALLRDVEKLERLQRAVRACGIDPEQLLRDMDQPASRVAQR